MSEPDAPPDLGDFLPVPVTELPEGKPLAAGLFHVTGEPLLAEGSVLTGEAVRALAAAGITHGYLVGRDRLEAFRREAGSMALGVDDGTFLKDGILALDLHAPDGRRLFVKGEPWNQKVREEIKRRGVTQVLIPRDQDPETAAQVAAFRKRRSEAPPVPRRGPKAPPKRRAALELEPSALLSDNARRYCTEENLEFSIAKSAFVKGSFEDAPAGPALKDCLSQWEGDERGEAEKAVCRVGKRDLRAATARLFDEARKNRQVDGREVGKLARQVVEMMLSDRELLLSAMVDDDHAPPEGFPDLAHLPSHAVRVAILAINIATTMGYSDRQVYELAYGALLADLGMTRVPLGLLEKPGDLTHGERLELKSHPVHSINMLQRFRLIPLSSPLIAYQSHERGDRSGYPKGRDAKLLHRFSKIVAVADSYCAVTAPRSHRPPRLPYRAIEELLRVGLERKLEKECLQGLLRCISLYPIGSWVRLCSDEVGRVVAAHEERYDRPCVRIHFEGGSRIPSRLVDLSREEDLKVVEAIPAPDGMEDALAGI